MSTYNDLVRVFLKDPNVIDVIDGHNRLARLNQIFKLDLLEMFIHNYPNKERCLIDWYSPFLGEIPIENDVFYFDNRLIFIISSLYQKLTMPKSDITSAEYGYISNFINTHTN